MEQKIDVIKKYKSRGRIGSFFDIENVPVGVAEKLMSGWPNIDPKDTQNESPMMEEMIRIAKKYKGKLHGYVIPSKSGRRDARISFVGFTITVPHRVALRLINDLYPDEISKIKGKWKLLWS